MGQKTSISWTDASWNPIRGCSRVSEGCRHCYAEQMAARFSKPGQPYHGLAQIGTRTGHHPKWTGEVRMIPEHLTDPLRWRKPRRIFVNSMSDLFHENVSDSVVDRIVAVMLICCDHERRGGHTFQTLTKRARRMREYLSDPATLGRVAVAAGTLMEDGDGWHDAIAYRVGGLLDPKIWWGVSVENQAAADERIPELLKTPAAVRFLSCEPLIGPVNLHEYLLGFTAGHPAACECSHGHGFTRCPNTGSVSKNCHRRTECGCPGFSKARGADGLHWVIAGCESGPGARSCDVAWLRSLRDQCAAAGVPYFLKQAMEDVRHRGEISRIKAGTGSTYKNNKTVTPGGLIELPYLDGHQHAAFPEVSSGS